VDSERQGQSGLSFAPLTPERFADLEKLFGPRGACGGCWCMYWRLPRREYEARRGEGTHQALKALVDGGEVPGLLAYSNGEPIGWCALGPRDQYPPLARSRILEPVDDLEVWSVVCFFVARKHRRQGVMAALLAAAVGYAQQCGARIVEGYPVVPRKDRMPDIYAYTGTFSLFAKGGFAEVARRSETRPIMRRILKTG
jgi:GNAT superfamily N-acetyltransferase